MHSTILPNFLIFPALTVWDRQCNKDSEQKDYSMNRLIKVFIEQPRLHRVCKLCLKVMVGNYSFMYVFKSYILGPHLQQATANIYSHL